MLHRRFVKRGAQVTAMVNPHLGDVGLLGHFESDDDEWCARGVLEEACAWLRAQGMRVVRGPINGSTWHDYRFVVEGGDQSFAGEPRHPRYYPRLWEAAGFVRCSRYGSFWIELDEAIARLAPKVNRSLEVRPAVAADLPAVYRIAHAAFREAYMFAPISPAEFASLYGRVPTGATSFVCDGGFVHAFLTELDGAPVGVIKTIAVAPTARDRGAYHALLSTAFEAFRARGARRAIGALIHTDGAPALMGWQRGEAFKRYALYEHA